MDSSTSMPRTVEEVFQDFRNRRSAICKALTTDVEQFYGQCDPAKENLCLYGHPDEAWEVNLPAEEVPPELPEPTLGINFAREGMPRRDWLSLVAVHSDAWLFAVSSFYGACLDKKDRKRLFNMINDLPTVLEVVSGRKTGKEKTSSASNDGSKSKPGGKAVPKASDPMHGKTMPKPSNPPQPKEEEDDTEEEEDEEEDEHGDTFCGSCGGAYGTDEFWIGCDECEKWYHGKCVKITPAKAEHIKHYKCPSCQSNKRARP